MFRKGFLCLCCLLLCMVAWGGAWAAPEAPEVSGALLDAARDLDTYTLRAVFDPQDATLICGQTTRLRNRTGQDLDHLLFHVYPNAFQSGETTPVPLEGPYAQPFSPGGLLFGSLTIGGEEIDATLEGEALDLLRVPLSLPAGAWVEVHMEYIVYLPEYQFRFGYAGDQYMLGNVFPILSIFEEGDFRADAYAPIGDPFYSECANYELTLDLPEGYQAAGTGTLRESRREDRQQILRYEAPAVREYALMITRERPRAEKLVSGVLLESYAGTRAQAESALLLAERALSYYLSVFGETYPYPTFTVSQASLGNFGGMEYPAYVVIHESLYGRGRESDLQRVIAHELAHQWWYAQVGSDQIYDPWLDEGLAEFSALLATKSLLGEDYAQAYIDDKIEPALRASLPAGTVLSSPIWQFSSWSEYDRVIYKRAAGMHYGLYLALGEDVYLSCLREYLRANRFGLADREALASAIERVTGENWRGYLDDYLDSRD